MDVKQSQEFVSGYEKLLGELDIEKKLNGFKELYEKSLNYYSYELSKLGLYSVRKKDGQLSYDYRKYFLKNTTRLDENLISLSIFFKKENERISNISHDNDEIFNDKLLNYKDTYRIDTIKSLWEKVEYLCYFYYEMRNESLFTGSVIGEYLSESGLTKDGKKTNFDAIISALVKHNVFKLKNGSKVFYEFVPTELARMEKGYNGFFSFLNTNDYLDESRFCNIKYKYVVELIKQINCCYKSGCYDACAVLVRRVVEISFIKAYQELGIDSDIKDEKDNYFMLEKIINNAKNNKELALSRTKISLDKIRNVGNYSAHKIYYIATLTELNDIKLDYRTILEELFYKGDFFNT